jgi:chromosome segregation ATPase
MHVALRSLSSLLALTLIAATQSCSGMGLKQSLEPQRKEVSEMHQQLTSDWESVGSRLDSIERDLVAFGNRRIETDRVDPAVVREAIELPEDADDARASQDEAEARMASYNKSLEGLDEQTRAEIESLRTTGARLRQQLYVELPASLADLTKRAAGMTAELAAIKGTADKMQPIARQNPLMTSDDMAKLVSDRAALNRDIESLKEVSHQIATDDAGYGGRLSAATTQFNLELSSLGE